VHGMVRPALHATKLSLKKPVSSRLLMQLGQTHQNRNKPAISEHGIAILIHARRYAHGLQAQRQAACWRSRCR
jgi:hypothetical protein